MHTVNCVCVHAFVHVFLYMCAPCGSRRCCTWVQPLPLHGVQSSIEEADCLLCEANSTTVKGSMLFCNIYTLLYIGTDCLNNADS